MTHHWHTTPDGYHQLHVHFPDGTTVPGPIYTTRRVNVERVVARVAALYARADETRERLAA